VRRVEPRLDATRNSRITASIRHRWLFAMSPYIPRAGSSAVRTAGRLCVANLIIPRKGGHSPLLGSRPQRGARSRWSARYIALYSPQSTHTGSAALRGRCARLVRSSSGHKRAGTGRSGVRSSAPVRPRPPAFTLNPSFPATADASSHGSHASHIGHCTLAPTIEPEISHFRNSLLFVVILPCDYLAEKGPGNARKHGTLLGHSGECRFVRAIGPFRHKRRPTC
jgi:hypothetical protein